MAAEGFPGVPFRDDFGSDYPLPAFKDPRAVAMQLENLGHGAATTPWQRELIRFQIDRRESPANSQVDSLQPMKSLEDRGSELFLFAHLLVRHSDYFPEADPTKNVFNRTPMQKILEPYDLVDTVVDDLDGLIVKLTSETLDVARLSDIAQILRRAGYRASLDYITPLGPILKGQSGAEPADEKDFPASFRPIEKQGCRVTVAIIDTGVTVRTDGWLEGIANKDNVDPLNVFPWGNPDRYLDFMAGHGTFCAGIVQQVAPGVKIAAYRSINSDGVGSDLDVAKTMVQAAKDGCYLDDGTAAGGFDEKAVTIINLSLGTETVDDQPPAAMEAALEIIAEKYPNTLVVAAAGNGGSTRPVWPAAFRSVVSVAALTANRLPADWSNRGFWIDCSTIGEGILSTYVTGEESVIVDPYPDVFGVNSWARWSGTSFATPQIAAAIARRCFESDLSPHQAYDNLLQEGVAIPDYGRAFKLLPGV